MENMRCTKRPIQDVLTRAKTYVENNHETDLNSPVHIKIEALAQQYRMVKVESSKAITKSDTSLANVAFSKKSTEIENAWGFFNRIVNSDNTIDQQRAPYIIRPFPDSVFNELNDHQKELRNNHLFDPYWRFDVFRPLYNGWSDWRKEFLYFVSSPLIIIGVLCQAMRLSSVACQQGKYSTIALIALLTIPAIIYSLVLTALSMIFSFLGIFTRYPATFFVKEDDPQLNVSIHEQWISKSLVNNQQS